MPVPINGTGFQVNTSTFSVERAASSFCKLNNIKTDAEFSAAIDAMTSTQLAAITRAFFKAMVMIVPND